jgi:hypothetical protein
MTFLPKLETKYISQQLYDTWIADDLLWVETCTAYDKNVVMIW